MPSDVEIANLALTKLGTDRILSFTDNVKQARSINAIYAIERDRELRAHNWSFATKRILLPALSTKPAFSYDFAYEKPDDFLKVIAVGDFAPGTDLALYRTGPDESKYRIEAKIIVTNIPAPLKLRYMKRVTDPGQFDPCFAEALACKLAMELCEELTSNANKRQLAAQEYRAAIMEAIRANAIEQPPEPQIDSSWLLSRLP